MEPRCRLDLLRGQFLILACVKQQRPLIIRFEIFDLTNVQRVVASGMDIDHVDHIVRYSPIEQRYPVARDKPDANRFHGPTCKVIAQLLLIFGQNADPVSSHCRKYLVHVRTVVQRHQN